MENLEEIEILKYTEVLGQHQHFFGSFYISVFRAYYQFLSKILKDI